MSSRFPFALKLGLSLAIVILVSVALVYFFTASSIANRFAEFKEEEKQEVAQQVCSLLGEYRARTGTWVGIERLVTTTRTTVSNGQVTVQHSSLIGPFCIADATGKIVVSTNEDRAGTELTSEEIADGIPIEFNGRRVGTLFLESQRTVLDPLEEEFLVSAKRSALWGGGIASGVALLLSALLLSQVLSPLRRLTKATERISGGDLSHRVQLHARDEFGQLGVAFNRMVERLRCSEEVRQTMTADIAHELRTPVTIIQGNLEAILDGIYAPSADHIAPIYEETLHLSRLIDDLRDLSLAEAGELDLDRHPTDLTELVRHVADTLGAAADNGQHIKIVEPDSGLPTASVDARRFRQVIANLLSNAVRHTPPDGEVSVRLAYSKGRFTLEVADDGPGISEDDLPHVFERFYRGDRARTRKVGSSGLGLAIVKQLVEAHGGEIRAENAPGRGAVFVIQLPAAPS